MKNRQNKIGVFLSVLGVTFLLSACQPPDDPKVLANTQTLAKNKNYLHCNKTVPYGFPQIQKEMTKEEKMNFSYFICHDLWTTEYRKITMTPLWTAEHVKGSNLKKYEDYPLRIQKTKGGIDKGYRMDVFIGYTDHLPKKSHYEEVSKSFKPYQLVSTKNYRGNERAMSQTYYVTNLLPLNRKNEELMLKTEEYIRELIEKYEEGYIFSGPVYAVTEKSKGNNYLIKIARKQASKNSMDIPNLAKGIDSVKTYSSENPESADGFYVPTGIYKLVYFPKQNRNIAFIIPNTRTEDKDPNNFRVNLATLERLTNIDFYPLIPKEKKQDLYK